MQANVGPVPTTKKSFGFDTCLMPEKATKSNISSVCDPLICWEKYNKD